MLSLSPIALFQNAHKTDAESLAEIVRSSSFTRALTFSLSEMSIRGATKEEMTGARIFAGILMNLSEPIPPPTPPLPSKELGQKPEEKKEV